MDKIKVDIILGTRPEAIKMAPVIQELSRHQEFDPYVISTGQHRQMLDQALAPFGIKAQRDLELMRPNQSLAGLTAGALTVLAQLFEERRPDLVLVQGDTTTVLAASLAAFYAKVPVGHVEAGLRSHDIRNPFPEEGNRKLVSVVTGLHFAPTESARRELLREGYDPATVVVTGNTVVDAMLQLAELPFDPSSTPLAGLDLDGKRLLLVTSHRRESWDGGLAEICRALHQLALDYEDVAVVYPVHLNPRVRAVAREILSDTPRVHLVEPLEYQSFLHLMRRAYLILTDSGGIQEEAPTFGVPVLVLRQVTERPEASRQGQAVIVGTKSENIVAQASRLLNDPAERRNMAALGNPYGDGMAAGRIARAILRWRRGEAPLLPDADQFSSPSAV